MHHDGEIFSSRCKITFQTLESIFQSLEFIFHALENKFHALENKLSVPEKIFYIGKKNIFSRGWIFFRLLSVGIFV